MGTTAGRSRGNPYSRPLRDAFVDSGPYNRLKIAGEMGGTAVKVVTLGVRPPFAWLRDAAVEFSLAFRRCALPLILSHSVYLIGFGIILFGRIVESLGIVERVSGADHIIWSREIATWITGMIFAGIVGSAMTADLGARKIREELDALSVLGVERIRSLVVPRVIAATFAMPFLVVLSLLLVDLVNLAIAPRMFDFSTGVFIEGLKGLLDPRDIYLTVLLKNLVLGFFVGVVACYKGVTAGGGAEGVGKAVNETVVITFFGIWLFNSIFNLAYFNAFPDVTSFRG